MARVGVKLLLGPYGDETFEAVAGDSKSEPRVETLGFRVEIWGFAIEKPSGDVMA